MSTDKKRHQVVISREGKSRLLRLKSDLFDLDSDYSEGEIVESLLRTANAVELANELGSKRKGKP